MLEVNSLIYYHGKKGDTFPGRVLKVYKTRIKITYNGFDGDTVAYVNPDNLEAQEQANRENRNKTDNV